MRRCTIVIAMLGAVVLSCAAPSKSVYHDRDLRHDEIQAYFMQIREWRAELNLKGVEPPSTLISSMKGVSANKVPSTCELPPEPKPKCTDVCGIAEHICENAEAICRIAGELENDRWADEKCASAKASCKEAKDNCCGCEAKPDPDDG